MAKNKEPVEQFELMKEFQKGLRIDKHSLDDELVEHGPVHHRIADMYERALADSDGLKVDIENLEAELYAQFKEAAAEKDEKLSETAIKMKIQDSKRMRLLNSEYLLARRRMGELRALNQSYQQRSYHIRGLIDLHTIKYYANESSVKTRDVTEDRADRNREETGKLRREKRQNKEDDE